VFRAGTQLSFLSVAVLIAYTRVAHRSRPHDPLAKLIADHRPLLARLWRRAATAAWSMTIASLVVGAAIAPLVAYHFHIVTPASILLTPVAGPLIAVALYAGATLVSGGWLVPPIAALLGAVCGRSLELTERIVVAARDVPGSYFYSAGFSAPWLSLGYGGAAAMAAVPRWRPTARWQLALAALWFTLGYAQLATPHAARDELRCTFLAMGHGTCVVMELPDGETILYDAGSLGSPLAASRTIASFLWSRGIERIDALVLSHADVDHYNAVPGLVERFSVDVVYVSPMMFDPIATDGNLTAPHFLRDLLAARGVPMKEIWMNDRLRTRDQRVAISILHPPRQGVPGRDNANSLLLSVEFAGRRILLPGDLESPGIERVMADPPTDCDILLAPHHGSAGSDPPGFAAWCTPEWVVVSGDRPERTTAAQHSYQAAGAQVSHTAASGAVSFAIAAETRPAAIRRGEFGTTLAEESRVASSD
jgi:competence protein ComEC